MSLTFSFCLKRLNVETAKRELRRFLCFMGPACSIASIGMRVFLLHFLPADLPQIQRTPGIENIA